MASPAMLTSEQLRAARAMLRWDQARLARESNVSMATIKRLEGQFGAINANYATLKTLRSTLEEAGIMFLDGQEPGLRLRGQPSSG